MANTEVQFDQHFEGRYEGLEARSTALERRLSVGSEVNYTDGVRWKITRIGTGGKLICESLDKSGVTKTFTPQLIRGNASEFFVKHTIPGTQDEREIVIRIGVGNESATLDPIRAMTNILSALRKLPLVELRAIKKIDIHPGANVNDPYWRHVYQNFSGSRATGGHGIVTFYGRFLFSSDPQVVGDTMRHELGHCIATRRFNSNAFPGEKWTAVIKSDNRPISEYGKNSEAEDFAESVKAYLGYKDGDPRFKDFKTDYPGRHGFLTELFSSDATPFDTSR